LKSLARDLEEHVASAAGQIRDVPVLCHGCCNVFGGLDASQLDQPFACPVDGLRDDGGGLGLALCADDGRLALLLGALDDKLCALGLCERASQIPQQSVV
jgi:hypothetical protein